MLVNISDFIFAKATQENCISHEMFHGSAVIFNDDPRTYTQLPSGDLVTHKLKVKSHCVRSREVCVTFLFISI